MSLIFLLFCHHIS